MSWHRGICECCGNSRSVQTCGYGDAAVDVCFVCQKETERHNRKVNAEIDAEEMRLAELEAAKLEAMEDEFDMYPEFNGGEG